MCAGLLSHRALLSFLLELTTACRYRTVIAISLSYCRCHSNSHARFGNGSMELNKGKVVETVEARNGNQVGRISLSSLSPSVLVHFPAECGLTYYLLTNFDGHVTQQASELYIN